MMRDRVAGLLWGFFFLVLFLQTAEVRGAVTRGLGPRFFPYMISVIGMLCCLSLIAQSFRGRVTADNERHGLVIRKWRSVVPAAGVVAVSVGYSAVWQRLGFVISSLTFMVLTLLILGERRPLTIVLYASGVVLVIYLIFRTWLQVPLPRGLFM